jgi:hypothetical protein
MLKFKLYKTTRLTPRVFALVLAVWLVGTVGGLQADAQHSRQFWIPLG